MIIVESVLAFIIAVLLVLEVKNNSNTMIVFLYILLIFGTLFRITYHFSRIRKLKKNE